MGTNIYGYTGLHYVNFIILITDIILLTIYILINI
jgi:hypothetical protein